MTKKIKVLFVAGTSRCGSTLLSTVLGQVDDVFAAGELCYIWDRGLQENSLCGCGERFEDCDIWPEVMSNAFESNLPELEQMTALRESFHTRFLFGAKLPFFQKTIKNKMQEYVMNLSNLYRAIDKVVDASLIIDSSKFPTHGYLLGLLPNIDLHVLHVVRDPRAVAYSWQRRKQYGVDSDNKPVFMPQYGSLKSTYWWVTWNFIIELLWKRKKFKRVRYEDFIDQPQEWVEDILEWVGHTPISSDLVKDKIVHLNPNHVIAGNPSRFKRGDITLRSDNEWQKKMPRLSKWVVTLLSGFYLRYYKYAFFI